MPILTAADSLRLGATPLNRVYAGTTKVWPANYLDAEVGTASTPDPGPPLPSQCVFVFRVLGTTTALGSLCSQYEVDPQRSWLIRRNQTNGAFTVNLVPSAGTAASSKAMTTSTPYTPPTTVAETLAVSIDQSVASTRIWRIGADGAWVADAAVTGVSVGPIFDSSTVIRIGSFSANATPWTGRIYWIEQRDGLDPAAGNLIWRFDASEYRSGTGWTDARGRVWTLINANSIIVP